MPNEDLITAKDKAAELGISRSTLTRRVQSGDVVPAFRADGDNGVMLFTPQSPPSVASPAAEGRPSIPESLARIGAHIDAYKTARPVPEAGRS